MQPNVNVNKKYAHSFLPFAIGCFPQLRRHFMLLPFFFSFLQLFLSFLKHATIADGEVVQFTWVEKIQNHA